MNCPLLGKVQRSHVPEERWITSKKSPGEAEDGAPTLYLQLYLLREVRRQNVQRAAAVRLDNDVVTHRLQMARLVDHRDDAVPAPVARDVVRCPTGPATTVSSYEYIRGEKRCETRSCISPPHHLGEKLVHMVAPWLEVQGPAVAPSGLPAPRPRTNYLLFSASINIFDAKFIKNCAVGHGLFAISPTASEHKEIDKLPNPSTYPARRRATSRRRHRQ